MSKSQARRATAPMWIRPTTKKEIMRLGIRGSHDIKMKCLIRGWHRIPKGYQEAINKEMVLHGHV